MLYAFQEKIIYINRKYDSVNDAKYYRRVMEKVVHLKYGEGYTAFFVPPISEKMNHHLNLWILFGGNAALGLDWYDFCVAVQRQYPHYSFLLPDYDGYGLNVNTRPSPENIERSMQKLFEMFKKDHKVDQINLLGHSLGSAVALRFASNNENIKIKRAILLSPFTSMLDMARVVLGPLPGIETLLRHRWDNIESLEKLRQQNSSTKIFIAHGTRDGIVPFDQGKRLFETALSSGLSAVEFLKVDGANHNDIISRSYGDILQMMEHDQEFCTSTSVEEDT
jgi:uncharacterized protein